MSKQNKTTRTAVFESNSSSTSSYTVYLPKKTDIPQYRPYLKTDKLELRYYSTEEVGSWTSRIQFLTGFLGMTGRHKEIPAFMEKISAFAGYEITMTGIKDESVNVQDDEDAMKEEECERIEDNYYSFCNDYGHGSVKDFMDTMNTLLSDDDLILAFVFSEGFVGVESWYND